MSDSHFRVWEKNDASPGLHTARALERAGQLIDFAASPGLRLENDSKIGKFRANLLIDFGEKTPPGLALRIAFQTPFWPGSLIQAWGNPIPQTPIAPLALRARCARGRGRAIDF